jgi:hypothetical protein
VSGIGADRLIRQAVRANPFLPCGLLNQNFTYYPLTISAWHGLDA